MLNFSKLLFHPLALCLLACRTIRDVTLQNNNKIPKKGQAREKRALLN